MTGFLLGARKTFRSSTEDQFLVDVRGTKKSSCLQLNSVGLHKHIQHNNRQPHSYFPTGVAKLHQTRHFCLQTTVNKCSYNKLSIPPPHPPNTPSYQLLGTQTPQTAEPQQSHSFTAQLPAATPHKGSHPHMFTPITTKHNHIIHICVTNTKFQQKPIYTYIDIETHINLTAPSTTV